MAQPILHKALPDGQLDRAVARLPSMQPVVGPWLFMDEAYGAQMAERRRLLGQRRDEVHRLLPEGLTAAQSLLDDVLEALPSDFRRTAADVACPDGVRVALNWDEPLVTLGQMIQQDVCILQKNGPEHILTGAVLCFPASWTLAEKIGRPLGRIHQPVTEYDAGIAARVQRLFDGVQRGKPLWRANALKYTDPDLFQPRAEHDQRPVGQPTDPFIRSERQTVLRLTVRSAVAFVIHTVVVDNRLKDHDQNEGRE